MPAVLTAPLTWPGFGEVALLALAVLLFAALAAGAVDAIVGGGGLILLPVLLLFLPGGEAIFAVATNKLAAVVGTASAAVAYARRVEIDWAHTGPMALAAFAGSLGGALLAAALASRTLMVVVLVALVVVGIYTWRRPELGVTHAPRFGRGPQLAVLVAGGSAIGFYDGLAGPGTGSFLVFLMVGLAGFAFLTASASAKVVNVATNLGALVFFLPAGVVLVGLGAALAAANLAGSVLGARLAVRHGSAFVRRVFLVVVGALVLTLAGRLLLAATA
ncbi:MAG: TSUP family transporter [Pseudonocardia sp.]